jgi:hypothetical protein
MPQGSVIGNHHEIELVPPDVRAPSLSCEISSYQIPTMSCLGSRHASWSVTCQLERKMVISATAPPRSYSPADKGRR